MWFINNRRRTLIPTTYDIDFPSCFSSFFSLGVAVFVSSFLKLNKKLLQHKNNNILFSDSQIVCHDLHHQFLSIYPYRFFFKEVLFIQFVLRCSLSLSHTHTHIYIYTRPVYHSLLPLSIQLLFILLLVCLSVCPHQCCRLSQYGHSLSQSVALDSLLAFILVMLIVVICTCLSLARARTDSVSDQSLEWIQSLDRVNHGPE